MKTAEEELKGILGLDMHELEYKDVATEIISKIEMKLVTSATSTLIKNAITLNKLTEMVPLIA